MSQDTQTTEAEIAEATKDLVSAARLLESAGVSRTAIYQILRDELPDSNHEQMLRQSAIRHINMMIEVLKGRPSGDVRAENGLAYMGRRAMLHDGARKIYKLFELHPRDISNQEPTDPANRDYWMEMAEKALSNYANDGK